MPRTRTFEPEAALDVAMHLFWQKGFVDTSYDDLVDATKVSRKGLYSAFGDKEKLFMYALERYRETVVPTVFGWLKKEKISRSEIIYMFTAFADTVTSADTDHGCFVVNTMCDAMMDRPAVQDIFQSHVAELTEDFVTAFERCGFDEATSRTLGEYYVGVIHAVMFMARSKMPGDMIRRYVDVSLNELRSS